MGFLFDVSISFLRKTTTNTRKINYYRNQVILNKLSTSKIETRLNVSRRQKRVTALRCLFSFFERMIAIRRKKNYHSKAHFVLYNIDSRSISFGDCISQEIESWARALEIKGPFLSQCYATIKHFCTLNSSMEKHQFFTVNRTQRAASNDVWTNFLAIIGFEIFEKKCVKNVTALRLDKPIDSWNLT